jgi:anti-sigma B factor antagonist
MTSMDLTFTTRSEGDWTVLEVGGELDLHTCGTLQNQLQELGAKDGHLAVDMAQVGFMDSSGLGVLVDAMKRMRDQDGELALVGVSGSPLKVLSITGLDKVIPLYASVADLPAGA